MSSGVNWKYRVSNADPNEPPISYETGVAWASDGPHRLTVGRIAGLDAVRTAYAALPGLGHYRNLWLEVRLSGSKVILRDAAELLFEQWLVQNGKKESTGHNLEKTVGRYIFNRSFVCGLEIAEHAGLDVDDRLLDVWERLAIAAEEYPRERWGICPHVTALRVEGALFINEVSREEAVRVLDAAEAWARAVDTTTADVEADTALAYLLDDEVVKAELNEGSSLRHSWVARHVHHS